MSIASSVCNGVLSQQISGRTECTYVENLKDPDEIQLPTRDLILITLRVEQL